VAQRLYKPNTSNNRNWADEQYNNQPKVVWRSNGKPFERLPTTNRTGTVQHQHQGNNDRDNEAELSQATVEDIEGELFSFQASFPTYAGFPEEDPIFAYKATSDPDTMYHHQVMKQPDAEEFRKAMKKEWNDQLQNGNFTMHRSRVPEGATILPAVWQMRRKET
jgi:hypothetical protein